MITDEKKLQMLLKTSSEKEKALEKNFIFQSVLFLVSLVYVFSYHADVANEFNNIPEYFKPLFLNRALISIIMPVLLIYYFTRMGYLFDSYLFQRRIVFELLKKNWDTEGEKLSNVYGSFTSSSFFEVINLYSLRDRIVDKKLPYKDDLPDNKVINIYAVVFTLFLSLNNVLILYFITLGFSTINFINGIFILLFQAIIVFGYGAFLYFNFKGRLKDKIFFICWIVFFTIGGIIVLKNIHSIIAIIKHFC